MRILVLGLGNGVLRDDGVGIHAARALRDRLDGKAEVQESSTAGLALLEQLIDYDKAIIIDAVVSQEGVPGQIHKLSLEDLGSVIAPSPHYAGLPEVIALANSLAVKFPEEIKIYAMEVEDPYTIKEGLTDGVRQALPKLIETVEEKVNEWVEAVSLGGEYDERQAAYLSR
ncbi:MAG: hydrogenase maturation protease [Anaerolineae bacterium]